MDLAALSNRCVAALEVAQAPYLQWGAALLAFALLAALSAFSGRRGPHPALYLALVAITLLLFRWPAFALTEQNPDESQAIAGAITLRADPVFWQAVDGGTHGPLVHYAPLLAAVAGLRVEYGSARLLALLLLLLAVAGVYGALRGAAGGAVAALATLPLVLVIGLSQHRDMVAYNGEVVAVGVLAIGLLLAARLAAAPLERLPGDAFAAGLPLGLVPFAKLQSVPMAAALAAWVVAIIIRRGRPGALAALLAGCVVPVAAVVIAASAAGVLDHLWASYVLGNLSYASASGGLADPALLAAKLARLGSFALDVPEVADFLAGQALAAALALIALAGLWRAGALRLPELAPAGGGALLVLAAIYSVAQPGYPFYHYLIFLLLPLPFLSGALLGAALPRLSPGRARSLLATFLLVAVLVPAWRGAGRAAEVWRNVLAHRQAGNEQAVAAILALARPGDRLVVWGWDSRYYVQTGLPQGARDATTAGAASAGTIAGPGMASPVYLARFMADLQRNRPALFVDAVGTGAFAFDNREVYGHECIPTVEDYVARNYSLVADLNGARVYVANERLTGQASWRPGPAAGTGAACREASR